MKTSFSIMSNLQTHYHFIFDYQKVDRLSGVRWLIYGTKHHKDDQLSITLLLIYKVSASFIIYIYEGNRHCSLDFLQHRTCMRYTYVPDTEPVSPDGFFVPYAIW